MSDDFFSKTHCDRCGDELKVRIMSWFTTETICVLKCSPKEVIIKQQLREKGDPTAMEGCGFIPQP